MNVEIVPYRLIFHQPAGTSRGIYTTHQVYYILLREGTHFGIGECAPLTGLSEDDVPYYTKKLAEAAQEFTINNSLNWQKWEQFPSIIFGFETALRMLANGLSLWDSDFSKGVEGIPINGLVWMNPINKMLNELEYKIKAGFQCVKFKIGAIRFEDELKLLQLVRNRFGSDIMIRVDANGAFNESNVFERLEALSHYQVHSIEQPIAQGNYKLMEQICAESPIPIAFDEELIGVHGEAKAQLLSTLKPQYIVLKPTLHGGICGSEEWILLAKENKIGYWITSALESNIGLTALAQWTASLNIEGFQGLGTGLLYSNNIDLPLEIESGQLWFRKNSLPSVNDLAKKIKRLNL